MNTYTPAVERSTYNHDGTPRYNGNTLVISRDVSKADNNLICLLLDGGNSYE